METTMGRVLTEVTIENLYDVLGADVGSYLSVSDPPRHRFRRPSRHRRASLLSLPTRLIEQLGLEVFAGGVISSVPGAAGIGELVCRGAADDSRPFLFEPT